jgi:hypothetical protein
VQGANAEAVLADLCGLIEAGFGED